MRNSLERRREFLSLVECCKVVLNLNGLKFSDYFELCRSTKTRSNYQYKIQTKLAKLNCYKYSFFVKVIKFWNDLPSNVVNCHDTPNINKCKLRLKNHMNIYWMDILYFFNDISVIYIYLYIYIYIYKCIFFIIFIAIFL